MRDDTPLFLRVSDALVGFAIVATATMLDASDAVWLLSPLLVSGAFSLPLTSETFFGEKKLEINCCPGCGGGIVLRFLWEAAREAIKQLNEALAKVGELNSAPIRLTAAEIKEERGRGWGGRGKNTPTCRAKKITIL